MESKSSFFTKCPNLSNNSSLVKNSTLARTGSESTDISAFKLAISLLNSSPSLTN